MKPTDIPTEPPSWSKNPSGYTKHQNRLRQLAELADKHGLEWSLPPEREGWDLGVDIIVEGFRFDLKTFGLRGKWNTWNSPYWNGREPQTYWEGCETDGFVHAGSDAEPSEWRVGFANTLKSSHYQNGAPYYFGNVFTVDEFFHDLSIARM